MKKIEFIPFNEIKLWLLIFLAINFLNLISILWYDTLWIELYTQLGFILIISCVVYVILWMVRVFIKFLKT